MEYAANAGYANTSVDFGLRHHWNVGFSILDLNLGDDGSVPFNPSVFLNVEKAVRISKGWTLILGTQNGVAPFQAHGGQEWENFDYIDAQVEGRAGQVRCGGYFADRAMSGTRNVFGYLLGFTLPLPWGGLALSGDLVSGRSTLSFGTLEVLWALPQRFELGLGVQLPMPQSGNDYSGVLTVNWN